MFYKVDYINSGKPIAKTETILVRVSERYSEEREEEFEADIIKQIADLTSLLTQDIKLIGYVLYF